MIIVGLTGGIGSGKSTVSDYLKRKGCLIIDADEISRAATAPGGPALEPILREFGAGVFSEDGTLDRKKMSEIVFSDTISRNKLEDIVVTIVINEFHAQIEHLKEEDYKGIVVFDAPLLFEFGMEKYVDESWFVTASLEARVSRVVKRDRMTRGEVMDRINSQMPSWEKEKLADYTINNSFDLKWLYDQIDSLLYRLKSKEGI
ncbi:MAG: dephospho-CoA kinase [Firmicutes bacterium]|jgi:dephospho-CoA kinase|nr:dephospho-CoA kinase [Bacillota bacterium]